MSWIQQPSCTMEHLCPMWIGCMAVRSRCWHLQISSSCSGCETLCRSLQKPRTMLPCKKRRTSLSQSSQRCYSHYPPIHKICWNLKISLFRSPEELADVAAMIITTDVWRKCTFCIVCKLLHFCYYCTKMVEKHTSKWLRNKCMLSVPILLPTSVIPSPCTIFHRLLAHFPLQATLILCLVSPILFVFFSTNCKPFLECHQN